MDEKIYVPKEKIELLVKEAINLSSPQGLGFLHFLPGEPSQELVDEVLSWFRENDYVALDMDYVQGRAVKLTVFRDEKGLYITAPWYDHSDTELQLLCQSLQLSMPSSELKHGGGCNCDTCRDKRGEGSRVGQALNFLG
ncbi:MAG: hypothetical protein HXS54_06275 [Theionarchaea archaeon]|nr:hypothetical protein [Theionarchaea archaeon]